MTCLSLIGFVLRHITSELKTCFAACSISLTCFAVITIIQIDSFESKTLTFVYLRCSTLSARFFVVLLLFVVGGDGVIVNVAIFFTESRLVFCFPAFCRIRRQYSLVHWQCFQIRFNSIAFRMVSSSFSLEKHLIQ